MDERVNRIGFIGLGRMGAPIARNILSAGFKLTIYDLHPESSGDLIARGAAFAPSPRAVAEQSAIVALAVVDDAQVDDVLTGAEGVFAGADPGTIVVVHSTVLPESIKRLAEIGRAKDVHVIDAPVSGGEAGARQKSLCYMVGGDAALLERCRELFATSAQEIIHMGALGSGAAAKLIVQVATCVNMLAASEAELMAAQCGLDFGAMQRVLKNSSGQSFVVDNWLDRFKLTADPLAIRRRRTEVFQKSLMPALELARQLGIALDGATLAERLMPRIMGLEK
ncbi:MAG: NAD(P)-dependent oxidoreductase [Candidatus Binatia bacterium]